MKRITEIEFINYKAFYESGEENKIIIPDGKSVLFYGENGSGKSSIYEGLKQFFASSDATVETNPARHIKAPITKTEIENQGTSLETSREVANEVSVKVTFSDNESNEVKTFGVLEKNTQTANYITQANLLNSFLSYRELLRTYLMENPKDREEFKIKFAKLVIEVILAKQINPVTQQTFQKSWDDLFLPRKMYKVENLTRFTRGLQKEIDRINLLLPTLLGYFEKGFSASLSISQSYIEYHHAAKVDRAGNYPIYEIDLEVSVYGESTQSEEENHLTVLNEARLSSLAISIYLASLINTPQENFAFKILFLDDIFIGLDMSNRLPLLEVIKSFKKPIIEQYAEGENPIAERILTIDGVKQTEPEPFFRNYQIFISTYDRYWFSVAKNWFEAKSKGKWCYFEIFANKKEGLSFNTPLIYTSLNNLQKANYHYSKHDYPSCANHLRKALEERLSVLLPQNEHYAEHTDAETGTTEIKKLKTLNQYLERFIRYCDNNGIDASELVDLKNLKDWYFNPFSHDNIHSPIFKRELDIAKTLVENIGKFEFNILLPAAERLYFDLDNGTGQTRNYKLELQENLRWIKSVEGNKLTNPVVQCYEWTQNADEPKQVAWTVNGGKPLRLISFYNNKLKHLLGDHELPNVDMTNLWNTFHELVSNSSLVTLIK